MLKALKKKCLSIIPSTIIPFHLLKKRAGINLLIPFYHIVSDNTPLHVKHLYNYRNRDEFRKDIEFFASHYNPITLNNLIDSLHLDKNLPAHSLLLTFDDGFREMYEIVAPMLMETGIPAVFFIPSDFLDNKHLFYKHKASILTDALGQTKSLSDLNEVKAVFLKHKIPFVDYKTSLLGLQYSQKELLNQVAKILGINFKDYLASQKPYLTSKQVKRLINDGFAIGSHSIDHPNYAHLSIKEQLYQTSTSIKIIRRKFGLDYGAFSFPHHDDHISLAFFRKLFGQGHIDVSFGTAGMKKDAYPNNLQRFDMERLTASARKTVSSHYALKIFRSTMGLDRIIRT